MVQTKKPSILLLFLVVVTCNFVGQAVMSSSVNENNNKVSKVVYSDVNNETVTIDMVKDKNIIVSDLTDKSQINSIIEEGSLSTDTIKELKTILDDTEIDNSINDN